MNRTVVLAVAVGLVLLVGGAVYVVQGPAAPESSTYGYSLMLDTNATLRNVTLYLPLPVVNGTSPFETPGADATVSVPDGWNYAVVETSHGQMLSVTANEIAPEPQPDGRLYATYHLGIDVPATDPIDTRDPAGREPVFGAMAEVGEAPCPNQARPDRRETCYAFDHPIYASYDAPEYADVGVIVVAGGVNDRDGSGTRINHYNQRVMLLLEGPQDGWVTANGLLHAGMGSYPWVSA